MVIRKEKRNVGIKYVKGENWEGLYINNNLRRSGYMLPVQFVYTENGERKSSLDEHKRRVEILEHNKRLNERYPVYVNSEKKSDKKII